MTTIYDYLRGRAEKMPEWLADYSESDPFPRTEFFRSRVAFYPGSGNDGHAVKVFGSTHAVHCFVYADFMVSREMLERRLEHPEVSFRGYRTLARRQLSEADLVPNGWTPHIRPEGMNFGKEPREHVVPYGFLEVLGRESESGDDHGPRRLAVMFLGADGVATYDALFCQDASFPAPFGVLLQDHGFGGNYTRFGQGGLLDKLAKRCSVRPTYLLAAENTTPWDDYERIDIDCDRGGMHGDLRCLYRKALP